MTERPILFNANSILCYEAGRKTQTRRLVKRKIPSGLYLQKLYGHSPDPDPVAFGEPGLWTIAGPDYPDADEDRIRCPYGAEGDRLWARETWATRPAWDDIPPSKLKHSLTLYYRASEPEVFVNWRPSIFMPRWASRHSVTLLEVRAQRLQDITEADAFAEGITLQRKDARDLRPGEKHETFATYGETIVRGVASARDAYIKMLRSKYAKKDRNPWLWVLTFPRFEKEGRDGKQN